MAFLPHIELPKPDSEQFAEGNKPKKKTKSKKDHGPTPAERVAAYERGDSDAEEQAAAENKADNETRDSQYTEHSGTMIHGQGVFTPPTQFLETTTSRPNKRMKKDISANEIAESVQGKGEKTEQYSEQDQLQQPLTVSPFGAIVR